MSTPFANPTDYVKTHMMHFGNFTLKGLNQIMNESIITSHEDRRALKNYLPWLHGRFSGCHIPEPPKTDSRHM